MSGQAGVIFAGQVLAVRPQVDLALASGSGWVDIEFRIDEAIRGCIGQATYVLREWSGLWAGGRQRYTVGQRLLMMLHTPSASGLSSPVGGQEGAIPLTGAGAAPGPKDRFLTAAEQTVDLRWIETRLLRSTASTQSVHARATALEPMYVARGHAATSTRQAMRAAEVIGQHIVASGESSLAPAGFESTTTVPLSGTTSQGITLRSVLAMFEAWEAEQSHASR